jgi:hypothetical protein
VSFAGKWIELEITVLNKISQTEKGSLTYAESRSKNITCDTSVKWRLLEGENQ